MQQGKYTNGPRQPMSYSIYLLTSAVSQSAVEFAGWHDLHGVP